MFEQEPLVLEDYRDLKDLDVASFPMAQHFEIEITEPVIDGKRGLYFQDRPLDVTIGFPWHNADELVARWRQQGIPLGTAEEPYHDADQDWRFIAWEVAGSAILMEGDDDAFRIWIRVPVAEYKAMLAAVIR